MSKVFEKAGTITDQAFVQGVYPEAVCKIRISDVSGMAYWAILTNENKYYPFCTSRNGESFAWTIAKEIINSQLLEKLSE